MPTQDLPLANGRPDAVVTIIPSLAMAAADGPYANQTRLYMTGGHTLVIDLPRQDLARLLWPDANDPALPRG